MPYRLSDLAEQDLDEIWSYVAEDASPTTADRLIDVIVDRFELLIEQPRMGRLRPEFGAGVRSFTVENHVIYYRHAGPRLGQGLHDDSLSIELAASPSARLGGITSSSCRARLSSADAFGPSDRAWTSAASNLNGRIPLALQRVLRERSGR